MNTTFFKLIISSVLLFALASCDSPKSLTKKADKLAEKKQYKSAVSLYMNALNKKKDFIAAQVGLRESGQKQVNLYLDDFFKSKNFGEKRAAIYHYRNANDLKKKINTYSIDIDVPSTYTSDYNSLVDEYVNTIYTDALALLDEENFSESEKLLKEVALLKPNFKEVNSLKNVATFEPIYRQANEYLELEKFRAAYYQYDKIPKSYKETEKRQTLALEAGLFTIGMVEFKNATRQKGGESAISSLVTEEMMKLKNPFIKLVDRKYTQSFIDEQIMGLSGQVSENTNVQAGELIGAKAILTGKLVSYSKQKVPLVKSNKKAWVERKVKKYNEETEKHYYETVYDKIRYEEYMGSNSVQVSFQFQLISTESGEILLSKLINSNRKDAVHFAETNVNHRKVVPGNWRWENKASPSDVVDDSYTQKRALRNLFKANKNLRTVSELSNDIYLDISKQVSQMINEYNPENE
jgi:tetratricopeptide (TPR) repeat protein